MGNDTQTLTLTGFLLARIAEDEAQAHRRFDRWREDGGVLDLVDTLGPSRVLADCEAKRQIVALAVDGFEHNPNSTLQILAATYADHPDYQEEWRG